ALFRTLELPFWTAVTLLEHSQTRSRADEAAPLFAEAQAIFERLQAHPWLARLSSVAGDAMEVAADPRPEEAPEELPASAEPA
ncbi:MAG: hypothetical protein ACRDLR_02165, partial [Gaiellaceae bacterium]